MVTFDIKDLYVNIPIDETLNIIRKKLLQKNTQITTNSLIIKCSPITELFYISTLTTRLIVEIFLKQHEDVNIKELLDTNCIALYVRYVDDTLVIFDTTKINLHTFDTYLNKTHNNIKLNPPYNLL
jgi:hypothetical protein